MKIILDNHFCIRDFETRDVESLTAHANNKKIFDNLRDAFPFPYMQADAKAWIQYTQSLYPRRHFAIATPDECIGGIGLEPQSDVERYSAEIGFWLGEAYWNRGIMTQAVQALTTFAFHEFGLIRLYAKVYEYNKASARVLEKCGYIHEATLQKAICKHHNMLDAYIYAKLQHHELK